MILMLHILIALLGIVVATAAYVRPTSIKINASYGLIAATLASGTYLVLAAQAQVLHACFMGVTYLLGVGALAIAARFKLMRTETSL